MFLTIRLYNKKLTFKRKKKKRSSARIHSQPNDLHKEPVCARLSTGSWSGADLQLSHIIGSEASVTGKWEGGNGAQETSYDPVAAKWAGETGQLPV